MSLLQKSVPALFYGGVAAAAVGAAVLSASFQPAVDHIATARANSECEAILNDKKPAVLLQKIGCTMRHGYPFGIR